MTEQERFIYENHKVNDNLTGDVHSSNRVSVNVLNELHEENEKLTKQLMDLENINNNLSVQRDEFFNGARENAELNGKLQKENEQLKRFITSMGFTIEKENGTITRATKELYK